MELTKSNKSIVAEFLYQGYWRKEHFSPDALGSDDKTALEISKEFPVHDNRLSNALKNAGILPQNPEGEDGKINPAILDCGADKKTVLRKIFMHDKAVTDPTHGVPYHQKIDPITKKVTVAKSRDGLGQSFTLDKRQLEKFNQEGNYLDIKNGDDVSEYPVREIV